MGKTCDEEVGLARVYPNFTLGQVLSFQGEGYFLESKYTVLYRYGKRGRYSGTAGVYSANPRDIR
jgi:hypothetical protein